MHERQVVDDTHDAQTLGQVWQVFVSLYILAGHCVKHTLLYSMPVKQLKQVFVVFVHVLHGDVQDIQVWLKYY